MLTDDLNRFRLSVDYMGSLTGDPTYNNWVNPRYILPGETIAQLLEDSHRVKILENCQSRYLALDLNFPNMVTESDFHGSDVLYDSSRSFVQHDKSSAELFKEAAEHMKDFVLVGIQDYVEESLILLSYRMGWQPPSRVDRMMMTSDDEQRATLHAKHYKILESINTVDIALYEQYKKIFQVDYINLINKKLELSVTWEEFLRRRYELNQALREQLSDDLLSGANG